MPGRSTRVHPFYTGRPPIVPRVKDPKEENGTPLMNPPMASPYTPARTETPIGGAGKRETPPTTPTKNRQRNNPWIELSPADPVAAHQTPRQTPETPAFEPEAQRYISEFLKTTCSQRDHQLMAFFDSLGLLTDYRGEFIDLELYQQIMMEHYIGIKPPYVLHLNWDLLSKTFYQDDTTSNHFDVIIKSLSNHIIPNPESTGKIDLDDGSFKLLKKAKRRYKAHLLAKVIEAIAVKVDNAHITSEAGRQLTTLLLSEHDSDTLANIDGLLTQSVIDTLALKTAYSKEDTKQILKDVTQNQHHGANLSRPPEKALDAVINLFAFDKLRENSEFDSKAKCLIDHVNEAVTTQTVNVDAQSLASQIKQHILNVTSLSVHHLVPINRKAIDWLIYIYTNYANLFDKYTAVDKSKDPETRQSVVNINDAFSVNDFEDLAYECLYQALTENYTLILETQNKVTSQQPCQTRPNFLRSHSPFDHYAKINPQIKIKFEAVKEALTELGMLIFGDRMLAKQRSPKRNDLEACLLETFSLFIQFSCEILPYASGNRGLIRLFAEKSSSLHGRSRKEIVEDIRSNFNGNYLNDGMEQDKAGLYHQCFHLPQTWPIYHIALYIEPILNALQRFDIGEAENIRIPTQEVETDHIEQIKQKKYILVSTEKMSALFNTLALTLLRSANFKIPTDIHVPTSRQISSGEDAPEVEKRFPPNIPLHARQIPLAEFSRKALVDLAKFKTEEKAWIAGIIIGCIVGLIPGLIVLGCYIHRKKVLEGRVAETNQLAQESEGKAPHTEQELRRRFIAPSKWSKSPNLFYCGNHRARSRSNRAIRKRNSGWALNSHEELDPDAKFSEVIPI